MTDAIYYLNGNPWTPPSEEDTVPGGPSTRGPHRTQAAMLCRMKLARRYHDGLVQITKSAAPTMGNILHLHQAFYWAARKVALGLKPPAWFYKVDLMSEITKQAEGYPELITRAEDCMRAFRKQYKTDAWIPVDIEREYYCALEEIKPNCLEHLRREVVTARVDFTALSQIARGDFHIPVDYKSLAQPWSGGMPPWDPDGKFRVDWQVGQITAVMKAAEPTWKIDTCVIQRILQVEPHASDRQPVRVPFSYRPEFPDLLEEAVARDYEVATLGRRLRDGWTRDACNMGWSFTDERNVAGRACEYRDLCLAETQKEHDALVEAQFRPRV